ncbi:MAG: DUF1844 domain-containing protein [Syntrophobacterales bacterium]|nr:DUF1844 domain-containing protein [Syntrophobacterales bacterium]
MEKNSGKGFIFRDRRRVKPEDLEENRKTEESIPTEAQHQEAAQAYEEAASQKVSEEGRPLPKVDFSTFVFSLASSALVHLGEVKDPLTGQISTNLQLARQIIDTLGMLEEKTKGNLDEAEEQLLKSLIYDLRIKFVKKVS